MIFTLVEILNLVVASLVISYIFTSFVDFKTKGDANLLPDAWYVPEKAVLGKVLCINGKPFRIPYIGYFSIFFHSITRTNRNTNM